MFRKIKRFFSSENEYVEQPRNNRPQPQEVAPKAPTPLWIMMLNTLFPTLCVIGYVLVGIFWKLWHPTWLVFLLVPIYYSLIEAIEKKNPDLFGYPFLAVGVYLLLGFLWRELFLTCWVILVTIPLYYIICAAIKKKNLTWLFDCLVPIVCIAAYLLMGFLGGWWHPGWVVFFIVPLYYQTKFAVKKYNKQRKEYDRGTGRDDHSDVETMTREEYEERRRKH